MKNIEEIFNKSQIIEMSKELLEYINSGTFKKRSNVEEFEKYLVSKGIPENMKFRVAQTLIKEYALKQLASVYT